jgi:hypothetical protein
VVSTTGSRLQRTQPDGCSSAFICTDWTVQLSCPLQAEVCRSTAASVLHTWHVCSYQRKALLFALHTWSGQGQHITSKCLHLRASSAAAAAAG